jgi:hypothetical protein
MIFSPLILSSSKLVGLVFLYYIHIPSVALFKWGTCFSSYFWWILWMKIRSVNNHLLHFYNLVKPLHIYLAVLDPFYSGDKKSDFHSVDLFMGKWSSPLLVKSQQYGCSGSERQSSFTQFPYVQRLCLVNSPIHISGHPMLLWSCLRLVIFWRSYYHPLMYLEC